jgi:IS30 family transposase
MSTTPQGHLSYEERCQIFAYKESGMSLRKIGEKLCRPHSTISREINRNSEDGEYKFSKAEQISRERNKNCSSNSKTKLTEKNVSLITEILEATQASPQQISGRLNLTHGIKISHETIYNLIKSDKKNGGLLYLNLRHKLKKYNKRFGKKAGRGVIPNRRDISERPEIVESKIRFGDFELDTIVGKDHQGAIVSIVDRCSKLAFLEILERGTAEVVADTIINRLSFLNNGEKNIHTTTSDNGKEFSLHEKVSKALNCDFFFAKPYHSWERGLNEHTNGLVRQYLPKKTEFTKVTKNELKTIENKINNRPRAILGFKTPTERFQELCPHLAGGAFHP